MRLFIPEPTPPKKVVPSLFNTFDLELDLLLQAPKARESFKVDGSGLAVAVLDTGLPRRATSPAAAPIRTT